MIKYDRYDFLVELRFEGLERLLLGLQVLNVGAAILLQCLLQLGQFVLDLVHQFLHDLLLFVEGQNHSVGFPLLVRVTGRLVLGHVHVYASRIQLLALIFHGLDVSRQELLGWFYERHATLHQVFSFCLAKVVEGLLSMDEHVVELGVFLVGPLAHLLDEACHSQTDQLGSVLAVADEAGQQANCCIRLDVLLESGEQFLRLGLDIIGLSEKGLEVGIVLGLCS